MKDQPVIGITDCSKYANYEKWIAEEGAHVMRLSYVLGNEADVSKCDGIILSGGEDVHPRYYNKMEYLPYCSDIDERRDDFEWKVLDRSEAAGLPLLGICRGLQMANVYFGGTLVPDIPSFGKFNHSRMPDRDRYHDVIVDPDSELYRIVGAQRMGQINSAHHQSAELVAKGFVATCVSPEGVVEGIERLDKGTKPYLQLVQWHPERMTEPQSLFSKNIKLSFLEAVRKNKKNHA